jgi:predicted Zn-dependent peptidase
LIMSQESVSNHMTHMAMDEIYYGEYIPVDGHLEEVARVTRDDVIAAAREFMRPESFSLVALGPEEAESAARTTWPPAPSPTPGS